VTTPLVAAITFDPPGGGVAAVSRLVLRALRDRWGNGVPAVALLDEAHDRAGAAPGAWAKVRFGARLAIAERPGRHPWVFFTHLAVARVQAYVPPWLRRPYGVFLHGIEVWRPLTPIERRVLDGAAVRVANSAFTVDRIREHNPGLRAIEVCPLAMPPDRHTGSPARRPGASDSRVVLIVARMAASERYKGHDELLAAWPLVTAEVPDAQLVIVGDGDDAPRLRATAGTLSGVVFTGFLPEAQLRAAYENAAVFAMPSRGEGFGLVYLEAMSHGIPCVGSTHDAASEVIEDGVTGVLVDPTDRQALADCLVRLLQDAEVRQAMGERARQQVRGRYSYDVFAGRFHALLDRAFDPGDQAALAEERSAP